MNIRTATAAEISDLPFALFDEGNQGDTITVVEVEGQIVAFAQHTGTTIYMVESLIEGKGYARALVEHILVGADYAAADNVQEACKGFWAKMGFQFEYRNSWGQEVWTWYPEEE